jgi:hypothetical protein
MSCSYNRPPLQTCKNRRSWPKSERQPATAPLAARSNRLRPGMRQVRAFYAYPPTKEVLS